MIDLSRLGPEAQKQIIRKLTHLSLFSGIGGLDLAAEMAGFTTVGQCEWADYPTKILEKHWPDVPRWRDIRTLTGESFYARTGLRTVDVVSGGFPCQPFSVAGKQKGKGDDRYLWPEMLRVIRELRPRWVLGENVPGILRIAAADVVSGLEREGYDVVVFDFEAAAVGAPHRRERIAFVGNAKRDGQSAAEIRRSNGEDAKRSTQGADKAVQSAGAGGREDHEAMGHAEGEQWNRSELGAEQAGRCGSTDAGTDVPDTYRAGLQGQQQHGASSAGEQTTEREPSGATGELCETVSDSDNGSRTVRRDGKLPAVNGSERVRPDHGGRAKADEPGKWWATEPDVDRVAHGVPDRLVGGEVNEKEHSEEICTESCSDNGEVRDVRGYKREDEPAPYRLYKAYGGHGSLHEMPCEGSFQAAGYCNVCRLRKDVRGEVAQEGSKNMQPGMPCGVWTDLREQAMEHFWDSGEPNIPRVTDGVSHRVDRLKCLGNAVVPQQFYPFFAAIAEIERNKEETDD